MNTLLMNAFYKAALVFSLVVYASTSTHAQVSESSQAKTTAMNKGQLITTMKTAVANLEMLEAFQAHIMAMMPPEKRKAIQSQQKAEQQSAAACMGIDVDSLVATESRIKSDTQKMLSAIDQCSIHLPDTLAMDSSSQTQIQPFSSCIYAIGAKELGVSTEKAEQCGYGERLVNRYRL